MEARRHDLHVLLEELYIALGMDGYSGSLDKADAFVDCPYIIYQEKQQQQKLPQAQATPL